MKTYSAKPGEVEQRWLIVDATDQILGRLASEIARVLRGKHKPQFTPHVDVGDFVVVVNAEKVKLTGAKLEDKWYRHHSGYPGGLRSLWYAKLLESHPDRAISKAVWGMLPKTSLGRRQLRKLKVYAGPDHPHHAQKPQPMDDRSADVASRPAPARTDKTKLRAEHRRAQEEARQEAARARAESEQVEAEAKKAEAEAEQAEERAPEAAAEGAEGSPEEPQAAAEPEAAEPGAGEPGEPGEEAPEAAAEAEAKAEPEAEPGTEEPEAEAGTEEPEAAEGSSEAAEAADAEKKEE